jgi:hypothetical protein
MAAAGERSSLAAVSTSDAVSVARSRFGQGS